MATQAYMPLPSGAAAEYSDQPPAYAAASTTSYQGSDCPGSGFKHDTGAYAATSACPAAHQAGAPYGTFPAGVAVPPTYLQQAQPTSYLHIHQTAPPVIVIGGCPACRVGVLEDEFSWVGILCAILFFPLGIVCCLALRERRCSNCGCVFT